MNREIKFRAWDKAVRELAYQFDKSVVCEDGTEFTFLGFNFHNRVITTLADIIKNYNRFTLMQFTGLKDKNGKDIFEGDIVKYGYEDFEEDKTIHQVKWCGEEDYPAFDLKPHLDIKCNGLAQAMDEGKIEVIGNIYENPELLK